MSAECGTQSRGSRISGARGRSSFNAQDLRCHHLLRTMPPSQSAEYAQRHDDGMMRVLDGLMEAHRHSPCDCWVDSGCGVRFEWSLQHSGHRGPMLCTWSTSSNQFRGEVGWRTRRWSIRELRIAADGLDRQGFVGPSWVDVGSSTSTSNPH